METHREDDPDKPDEIDQVEELGEAGFGEHEDQAQKEEWAEDAKEGGA